ncbi:MAG: murein biosynthesis integral membrane protein MurJ [Planctomycetota bacterium]
MSNVIKSARTVGICILISRITGLFRDVFSAKFFGTGAVWDAFLLAFAIPNLFRRMFGEGALSSALVPAYSEFKLKGDAEKTSRFLGATFTAVILILTFVTVVGIFAALIVKKLIPLSEKWEFAIDLFPVMLPYVVPICLVALVAAVLSCHGKFAIPALSPVILNIFWIAGLFIAVKIFSTQREIAITLASIILVAGFFQFLMQIPSLKTEKVKLPLRLDFKDPGLMLVRQQWFPIAFSAAVMQVNILSDRLIAMGLVPDSGGVSTLYYADRLLEFPLALVGIAAAIAALPSMSECIAKEDSKGFAKIFIDISKSAIFISIPAAVGLAVLRTPIIRLLFERGEFTADSTKRTAVTLLCYASSVWSYSLYHITTRAFYSLKESKIPARIGAFMVFLNISLNLILVFPLAEAGIALATSITSIVNLVSLHWILHRKVKDVKIWEIWRSLLGYALLSIPMAAASYGAYELVAGKFAEGFLAKLLEVILPVGAGMIVFIGGALICKIPEAKSFFSGKRK